MTIPCRIAILVIINAGKKRSQFYKPMYFKADDTVSEQLNFNGINNTLSIFSQNTLLHSTVQEVRRSAVEVLQGNSACAELRTLHEIGWCFVRRKNILAPNHSIPCLVYFSSLHCSECLKNLYIRLNNVRYYSEQSCNYKRQDKRIPIQ